MLALRSVRCGLLLTAAILIPASLPPTSATRTSAQQADPHSRDTQQIRQVLEDQQLAWNRGDVDSFMKGYWRSPELTFSGSGGIERGWEGVHARYLRNYPDRAAMGLLDFSGLEFRFLGPDATLVLGRWHLKREIGDVGGVYSLVLQRFPEGWRIVHDHTSVVTPRG